MSKETKLQQSIDGALRFASLLERGDEFLLFERSETTPYARCFAIFIRSLCKDTDWLKANSVSQTELLNSGLLNFFRDRKAHVQDLRFDKPVLQLLCFTLSALDITGGALTDENMKIIEGYLSKDLAKDLEERGVFLGSAGSGNYAMFRAVMLLFAKKQMGMDCDAEISEWVDLHLANANNNGFWGENQSMQFLQFQNGYHQYEIFEALDVADAPWTVAARSTAMLADKLGHFAPYPGGGGCYDYDAIFMLTSDSVDDFGQVPLVKRTLDTILAEQNKDGGFCESRLIRTNTGMPKPLALFSHVLNQPSHCRASSTMTGLNLYRRKHNRVRTHWCETDRRWNESNAWDTYFRLLLIARASKFLGYSGSELFKISDYPGIG